METFERMGDLPGYSTQSLPIIPEPHTIIFNQLLVLPFVLHFLNCCYRDLDYAPSVIPSNKQSIKGQIRAFIELKKTLYRCYTVNVFYLCFERKDEMGCQIGMIVS